MIRIAICAESCLAQALFDSAVELLRSSAMKCEISRYVGTEKIIENIRADKNYYDIYVVDTSHKDTTALLSLVRSKNLTAAVIFVGMPGDLAALLRYRPSAILADEAQLSDVLLRCINEQLRCLTYFTVKNKDSFLRINLEDISFFESRQRLAIVHSKKHTVEFYAKLSDVMADLPAGDFIRCHQSYIVNIHKISRLDKANRCFILQNGTAIEISKSSYAQAVAAYADFLA